MSIGNGSAQPAGSYTDHRVAFPEVEGEEDNLGAGVLNSRKLRKYRPITQSFYGVHHHKRMDPPAFRQMSNSIRTHTLAINNLPILPNQIDDDTDGFFGLPLKQVATVDAIKSYGGTSLLPPNATSQDYLNTTHSDTLQRNLHRLLGHRERPIGTAQLGTSATSNAYRPSEALSLLFTKRASSLFDNNPLDDAGDRRSLLSATQSTAETTPLNQTRFNPDYHTFGEEAKPPSEVGELDGIDAMPVPDYANMTWQDYCLLPVTFFPPLFLGVIVNFLNAVSYGMIIFPTHLPIFKDFGPDGVAMFLVSTIVSQFVLAAGGTGFACGVGAFMLEVVPFLYLLIQLIIEDVGENNPQVVVATTMVAYAVSSMVTGLAFFLLGSFKLGRLVGFFPRHILVGCIGGVGYFLCQTALETVSRVQLSYFELGCWLEFFKPNAVALWGTSVALASTLKYLQRRINSPILLPFFYLTIPAVFFAAVWAFNLDPAELQARGWLFPAQDTSRPFYNFYRHFDFANTSWSTLPKLVPTMLALTFFGVLHVPINVPAVALTIKKDVFDVDRELVGHGWSNLVSGLCGSLQNYLTYSSSVLFYKSGGNDWCASAMLAVATVGVWVVGPGVAGYVPCVIVGCMIFHLGLELLKEGVFETYGVMSGLEYMTIWLIVAAMALLGFVEGVFMGIVLACLFFVYIYSRRAPIRASYSGHAARSTVRRVYHHRRCLDQLASQIHVIKLQGFMFFGTIVQVESHIRAQFDDRLWKSSPIRFLLLDLTLVTGLDFSAAEAFIRVRRLVETRRVHLIICGVGTGSEVGLALHAVGLWDASPNTLCHIFPTLNTALEWCENTLLELCYLKLPTSQPQLPLAASVPAPVARSPRSMHLENAIHETLNPDSNVATALQQPLALLVQIFGGAQPGIDDVLFRISGAFASVPVEGGEVLWRQGELADCLYLVESGLLKVTLSGEDGSCKVVESILPGAMVGELAMFTSRARPFTVTCERGVGCQLWRLTRENFDRLSQEDPHATIKFMQWSLAYSAQEMSLFSAHAFELL
ncbi:hypothetical protein L0F63_004878 [Massospora cicadina]|nr:hypothetical protein L0F63_004878 [Massospora cicadina]